MEFKILYACIIYSSYYWPQTKNVDDISFLIAFLNSVGSDPIEEIRHLSVDS